MTPQQRTPLTPDSDRVGQVMVLQNLWDHRSRPIELSRDSRFKHGLEYLHYAVVRWVESASGYFVVHFCNIGIDRDLGEFGVAGEIDSDESEFLGNTFDEAFTALEALIEKGVSL